MSISLPLLSALLLLACTLIYHFLLHPIFLSSLSKIPSAHPTTPFSSLWILYIRYTNIENATLLRLHREKGAILRLGPNEISVNCYEEGLKTVYGGNFDKTEFYPRRFANYGGVTNMLSIMNGKEHAIRKRMMSSIFSKSQIMTSSTARSSLTTIIYDRFLPLFARASEKNGQPIDVLSLSYAYSIDSFMGYQFGLDLGSNFIQDVEQREWYLRNFMGRRPYLFWVIEVPRFYAFVQRLGVQLIPDWFFQGIKEIEQWNLEICDKAEKMVQMGVESASGYEPVVFSTMRTAMLKADSKAGKPKDIDIATKGYPNRFEIASEMLDHNAASLETSGVILTYIFYELSIHPDMQAQLREELHSLSPPISVSATSLPDPKTLDVLPLLDAIIQETMRVYAPAPGPQPRVTPYPSCRLAGIDDLPGGVRVSANAWCLHRNEDVFPDSEKWKPERWVDEDEKKLVEMRKWLWAFSSGGRMCIGSHFALNSLKHAVAAVYTTFESVVVDAEGVEQTDGYTTGPQAEKILLGFRKV